MKHVPEEMRVEEHIDNLAGPQNESFKERKFREQKEILDGEVIAAQKHHFSEKQPCTIQVLNYMKRLSSVTLVLGGREIMGCLLLFNLLGEKKNETNHTQSQGKRKPIPASEELSCWNSYQTLFLQE